MKIFIDAGANDSCSARIFRKLYDNDNEYHIYSFEVDPLFLDNFNDIPNLTFVNKALWIKDGYALFYRSHTRRHCGGTLLKSKSTGNLDKKNPIKVETIDFSKWIMNNFNKDDEIILKMDIEGAEYTVLGKMFNDGSFEYIDKLWIEWHCEKVGVTKKQHDDIVNKINIPTKKWRGVEEAEEILGKDYLKGAN